MSGSQGPTETCHIQKSWTFSSFLLLGLISCKSFFLCNICSEKHSCKWLNINYWLHVGLFVIHIDFITHESQHKLFPTYKQRSVETLYNHKLSSVWWEAVQSLVTADCRSLQEHDWMKSSEIQVTWYFFTFKRGHVPTIQNLREPGSKSPLIINDEHAAQVPKPQRC